MNLPVALLMRLFGMRVVFIETTNRLRSLCGHARLDALGLEWVNYPAYKGYQVDAELKLVPAFALKILETSFGTLECDVLIQNVSALQGDEGKARAVLLAVLQTSLEPYAHSYALAEYFQENGMQAYIFQARDVFCAMLNDPRITRVRNLNPFFRVPWVLLRQIANVISARSMRRLRQVLRTRTQGHATHCADVESTPAYAPKVLYFPHKGISYGDLFLKDQYYVDDPDSPFHRERIQHVELNWMLSQAERKSIAADYEKHGLNVEFVDLPQISVDTVVRGMVVMAKVLFGRPRFLTKTLMFARILKQVSACEKAFSHYSGAQVALLGHDYLFPKIAIVALQAIGVKVVAVQERFVSAFIPSHSILADVYCVHGNLVKRQLEKAPYAHIKTLSVTGDPRASKIFQYQDVALAERAERFSAFRNVCLVLDFHSDPDPFANAMYCHACNWSSNIYFYEVVARLAEDHPECMFIIRGKNAKWLNIPALRSVALRLDAYPNVIVDQRYDLMDRSYCLAAMADIIIARQTSLCDQCLAAGRPVLIYDVLENGDPIVAPWFDYEPFSILINNEQDLHRRFHDVLYADDYISEELFREMRQDHYNVTSDADVIAAPQRVKSVVHGVLDRNL